MPETVPNQRVIHIHRDMPQRGEDKDYLAVKNQNLYDAYRTLREGRRGATAIYLWLVLAGNKDGFDLAFSPKAIEIRAGMPESTCRDAMGVLIDKGYLVQKREGSNVYDFYERPEYAPKTVSEAPRATEPEEIAQREFVF